jgi:hypothetical protein
MKSFFPIASLLSLTFLTACGDSASTNSMGDGFTQNEVIQSDGSNVQGLYGVDLYPMNYNLHFKKIGAATIKREGDNFEVKVRLKYGPKGTTHRQAIYTGRRCPTLNDDLNKDAYIDMSEALAAIGKISIPLDMDLDSQDGARGVYPSTDSTGKYFYQVSASFERLFADLKAPDEDPMDDVIKIAENEGITLPGRVLLIQGTTESANVPATASGVNGESARSTIPIACGYIWKVKEVPEEVAEMTAVGE